MPVFLDSSQTPKAAALFSADVDHHGRFSVPVISSHAINDSTVFVEGQAALRQKMVAQAQPTVLFRPMWTPASTATGAMHITLPCSMRSSIGSSKVKNQRQRASTSAASNSIRRKPKIAASFRITQSNPSRHAFTRVDRVVHDVAEHLKNDLWLGKRSVEQRANRSRFGQKWPTLRTLDPLTKAGSASPCCSGRTAAHHT